MSVAEPQSTSHFITNESLGRSARRSVADLDVGVSARQALGGSYARPKHLEAALAAYRAGTLVLPPQPVWEGDATDWTADPFNDRNWRFQHHTLRWMNPLRWAAVDGDEEARVEWVRIARSWAEANVPAEKSASDFAWRDMADGNRAIQLSLGASLVGVEDDWFVELLGYHRDWLMDESHIVGKNHGLHQHAGLVVVGAALRDRSAVETAVARMRTQFASTFDNQGANDEGSSTYHQMNMNWWNQAWERVQREGITPPSDVPARIASAANVLAHISMPNGILPQIGDANRGKVSLGHSAVTDYVATSGRKGAAPKENALILNRGYVISRSGWGQSRPLIDESHTVIRYGEELRAHSHRDRGSVHIYADGQPWLVDSGFHSYQHSASENRYLKSRDAHNVASIIGRPHVDSAPVDLVASNINPTFHDFTFIDRGYVKDELSRRILYFLEADCWLVSDQAKSKDPIQISQRWHVEPGSTARILDTGFRLSKESKSFGMHWLGRGNRLSLAAANHKSHDAWIGTKWKTLEPSTRISAESPPNRPHLVTLFGAYGRTPLSVVESRLSSDGSILLYIGRGAVHWRITIHEEKVTIKRV